MASNSRHVLRQEVNQSAGLGALAPHVCGGQPTLQPRPSKSEHDQGFIRGISSLEEGHLQIVVMQAHPMQFQIIGRPFVKVFGSVPVLCSFGNLC